MLMLGILQNLFISLFVGIRGRSNSWFYQKLKFVCVCIRVGALEFQLSRKGAQIFNISQDMIIGF